MEKFFSGQAQKSGKLADALPEKRKNRPQSPSRPQLPGQAPGQKPGAAAQPQVAAADAEAQIDPYRRRAQQEQQIRRGLAAPAQGPQQTVVQPQQTAQQQTAQQAVGRRLRPHPNRRRQEPPCRGSS